MKKLLIILLFIFTFFSFLVPVTNVSANCAYNTGSSIAQNLDGCLETSKLVNGKDVKVDGKFGEQIKQWTNNIALYLGVFAVGSIVLGALMMTISTGEEEKVKKAKDIVKWGMIGFLGIISASAIINLVVKIMYSI